MNKKIVGIFICMLLICTVLPTSSIKIKNYNHNLNINNNSNFSSNYNIYKNENIPISPWWLIGSDQKQINDSHMGAMLLPKTIDIQEFKPSRDKLTAVALKFLRSGFGNTIPEVKITVSIKNAIDGDNLTVKSNKVRIISEIIDKWILFDFDDIDVIPETVYYICVIVDIGDFNNLYVLKENNNNSYDRGSIWRSNDYGITWNKYDDYDYCFITYWKKPLIKSIIYSSFINLIGDYPNLFQVIQDLIMRGGDKNF